MTCEFQAKVNVFRNRFEDTACSLPRRDSSTAQSYGYFMDVAVRCPRVKYGR